MSEILKVKSVTTCLFWLLGWQVVSPFNIILKLHILDSSLCFLVPSPVMQVREERKIASLKDEEDRGDEAESVLTK